MTEAQSTLLIACGALAREIVAMIRANGWDHMKVVCLPARLHNDPGKIPEGVRARIREGRGKFERIFVLFADCGTGGRLDRVLEEEGVERIVGNHCYEVYAGAAGFEALVKSEPASFFLTDFLVRNFDRLIIEGMGIDRHPKLLKMYFGKYRRLVYLAQSSDPVLLAKAEAAAAKLGLELDVRNTGFGGYETFLGTRAQRAQ
ncbi:MAG: DUF1638 domain-containing protein [Alphaproteobacteria bacterium]